MTYYSLSSNLKILKVLILKLQEVPLSENFQTSPAKVTGTTDKDIVVRIGGKRLLLSCDDEVCHEIEKIIPRKVQITFREDRLISFQDLQE